MVNFSLSTIRNQTPKRLKETITGLGAALLAASCAANPSMHDQQVVEPTSCMTNPAHIAMFTTMQDSQETKFNPIDQAFEKLNSSYKETYNNLKSQFNDISKEDVIYMSQVKNYNVITVGKIDFYHMSNSGFNSLITKLKTDYLKDWSLKEITQFVSNLNSEYDEQYVRDQSPSKAASNLVNNVISLFPEDSREANDINRTLRLYWQIDYSSSRNLKEEINHLNTLRTETGSKWTLGDIAYLTDKLLDMSSSTRNEYPDLKISSSVLDGAIVALRGIDNPKDIIFLAEKLHRNIGCEDPVKCLELVRAFWEPLAAKNYSVFDVEELIDKMPYSNDLFTSMTNIRSSQDALEVGQNLLNFIEQSGFDIKSLTKIIDSSLVRSDNAQSLNSLGARIQRMSQAFDSGIYTAEQITNILIDMRTNDSQEIQNASNVLEPYYQNGLEIDYSDHQLLMEMVPEPLKNTNEKDLASSLVEVLQKLPNPYNTKIQDLKERHDFFVSQFSIHGQEAQTFEDLTQMLQTELCIFKSFPPKLNVYRFDNDLMFNLVTGLNSVLEKQTSQMSQSEKLILFTAFANEFDNLAPHELVRYTSLQDSPVFDDVSSDSILGRQKLIMQKLKEYGVPVATNRGADALTQIRGIAERLKHDDPDKSSKQILNELQNIRGYLLGITANILYNSGINTQSDEFKTLFQYFDDLLDEYDSRISGVQSREFAIAKLIVSDVSVDKFKDYLDKKTDVEVINLYSAISDITAESFQKNDKDLLSGLLGFQRFDQLTKSQYERAVRFINNPHSQEFSSIKGVVAMGLPIADSNSAFSMLSSPIVGQLSDYGYVVIPFQENSDQDLVQKPSEISSKIGQKFFATVISGHGTEDSIRVANDGEDSSHFDTTDKDLMSNLANATIPNGSIVILGCSTGKDSAGADNLQTSIAKSIPPGISVNAPAFDAQPAGVNLKALEEGTLSIDNVNVDYES